MKKLQLIIIIFLLKNLFFPNIVNAEGCGGPVPLAPEKLSLKSGPLAGQVTLYWKSSAYANRYAVVYGDRSNTYKYGAVNIGGESSLSYTVSSLVPGSLYYFRLAAARDCASSPFSYEISGTAMNGQIALINQSASSNHLENEKKLSPSQSNSLDDLLKLKAVSGPSVGEVNLYWQQMGTADNYHLVYGENQDEYKYGALNIGKVTDFTVRKLIPGVTYYFSIIPLGNNRPIFTSRSVSAQAKKNIEIIETTIENLQNPHK